MIYLHGKGHGGKAPRGWSEAEDLFQPRRLPRGHLPTRLSRVDHTIPFLVAGTPLQHYNSGLILALRYNLTVAWDVEVTDEFKAWWDGLTEAERISVERSVLLLEERGPHLPFPYSSRVTGSHHAAMRELRVQH